MSEAPTKIDAVTRGRTMKHRNMGYRLGLVAALLASGYGATAVAQVTGLEIGGREANYGVHPVAPGFLPDPMNVTITSGGDLDARALNLGPGCKGWVTRRPDAIIQLSGVSRRLRFYVTPAAGRPDTTLIINAANGSWRCNDDSWNTLSPTVDINNAPAGQYDVWVGSYHQGEHVQGVLHVTEVATNHP